MSRRRHTAQYKTNPFLQSFSDIMAGLLLVFVLVMAGSILKAQEEFETAKKKLDDATATAESLGAELGEKEAQLEKILGIRNTIIERLKEEFSKNDMGGKLSVDEQTGAIVFDSNLLFEFGKHRLSREGKQFLKDFLPKYTGILLSDEFIGYVAEIVIEGHTDPVSGYMDNMKLSQERAYAVADYVLRGTEVYTIEDRDLVRRYISVNGRSESELIYDENGEIDPEASRRVELQFQLKDDEMIAQMLEAIS